MRTFISIVTCTLLASCNNSNVRTIKDEKTDSSVVNTTKTNIRTTIAASSDTTKIPESTLTNHLTVLVLPPYDLIANEGISPDIQNYLESIFKTDTTFTLIKFPYRRLINISYQNVFDKKYCSPIMNKIKTDIIIMSKIDQSIGTGNMITDRWNLKIKIFNTETGLQKLSNLNTNNLTRDEIENLLRSKQQELFRETKNTR